MILLFFIFILLFRNLFYFDTSSAKKINAISETIGITINNPFDS